MREHNGHRAILIQVVEHVLDEGEIRFRSRGELPVFRKPIIAFEDLVRRPFRTERWIGHDRFEKPPLMLGMLERVFLLDVEGRCFKTIPVKDSLRESKRLHRAA